MDSRDYQFIITIAETRSISRAAEKLYITQPYLSKIVSNIERSLGKRLFDRSKSPLELTPEGKLFVEYSKQIIDIESRLAQEIGDEGAQTFSIGASTIIGRVIFPRLIPLMLQDDPQLRINAAEGTTIGLEEDVDSGKLDLALISQPTFMDGLEYELLQTHRLLLVVPCEHSLYRTEDAGKVLPFPYDISVLQEQTYVLASKKMGLRRMVDRFMSDNGLVPRIRVETSHYETGMQIAKATGTLLTFIAEYYKSTLKGSNSHEPCYYYFENWPQLIKMFAVYKKANAPVKKCMAIIQGNRL